MSIQITLSFDTFNNQRKTSQSWKFLNQSNTHTHKQTSNMENNTHSIISSLILILNYSININKTICSIQLWMDELYSITFSVCSMGKSVRMMDYRKWCSSFSNVDWYIQVKWLELCYIERVMKISCGWEVVQHSVWW